MEIMSTYFNTGKFLPEVRGKVVKSRMGILENSASLEISIEGHETPFFLSGASMPTILVGWEVVISFDEKDPVKIVGLQVVDGAECLHQSLAGCSFFG